MRHTIICGVPCNYVNEKFKLKIGRTFEEKANTNANNDPSTSSADVGEV